MKQFYNGKHSLFLNIEFGMETAEQINAYSSKITFWMNWRRFRTTRNKMDKREGLTAN